MMRGSHGVLLDVRTDEKHNFNCSKNVFDTEFGWNITLNPAYQHESVVFYTPELSKQEADRSFDDVSLMLTSF